VERHVVGAARRLVGSAAEATQPEPSAVPARPDDPPRTPVGAATPEDRAATAAHVVSGLRAAAARYPDDPDHPTVGPLVLDCDTLHVPDADQAVIVYSAESGTHEAEALALLRVLGTQSMEPSEP
jgi:hypothetical protein